MSYFGPYECMDMYCPDSKSDEQLAAAIAAYLEEHPIDAVLDEAALAAAVAAYLEEHPIDAGLDEAALAAYLVENGYLTDAALADAITQALAEAKGSGEFDGEPGVDGADGSPGADGYTPVRGVDYWTDADQQQIVADVLAALPDGDGVSY